VHENVRSIIAASSISTAGSTQRAGRARFGKSSSRRTTITNKKKRTIEEEVRRSLGRDFFDSYDRTQRMLAERIAHYDRKIEEKRRAGGGS
jgi:hypothetical protein